MRIAMAQIDSMVGRVDANRDAVLAAISRAREAAASIVMFPELTLTGYPLLDLTLQKSFLAKQRAALDEVAAAADGITVVIGFVDQEPGRIGANGHAVVYNAAAVLRNREIAAVHRKILLPEYDIFFEQRYFTPGTEPTVVDVDGVRCGVQICEDLWDDHYERKVTKTQVERGAQVILNLSASPFHIGKGKTRRELVRRHVAAVGRPFFFCNQVGSEDGYEGELIFDGDSFAIDANGRLIGLGRSFEEDLVVCDVDARGEGKPIDDRAFDDDAEGYGALVCGVRSYAKRAGFKTALLGLSGGIDSALVATIAAEALGPKNVLGVSMPSRYSSEHSKSDAERLAENLGIEYRQIPIEAVFQSYLDTLAPSFEGLAPDVTEENLQARVRGAILMALSNKTGALLLSTGNKTEVALGYCTLYGDMNGGLMVIADVSKSRVYSISRHINAVAGREVIPQSSIDKVPSAELRDAQVDPFDYEIVSPLVDRLVEDEATIDECVAMGYDRELVTRLERLIRISEYKRRQAAPGIRITRHAFGVGRRMPIA